MRELKGRLQRLLKIDFVRFCMVGALGFTINFVLLTLIDKNLHSPFVAQLIAGEIALFSNFMFHHRWTYKADHARKAISTLIVQFHVTSWVAILGSALLVTFCIEVLNLSVIVALICSSAVSLFWNFGWSRYVIWRKRPTQTDEEEA